MFFFIIAVDGIHNYFISHCPKLRPFIVVSIFFPAVFPAIRDTILLQLMGRVMCSYTFILWIATFLCRTKLHHLCHDLRFSLLCCVSVRRENSKTHFSLIESHRIQRATQVADKMEMQYVVELLLLVGGHKEATCIMALWHFTVGEVIPIF